MGKTSTKEGVKTAKELTKELLKRIDISAKVKASEQDSAIQVEIEGDDLGLLVGFHGENLEALQLILGLMVNKKTPNEEWLPVNLDVGGWRKERAEALKAMIEKAALEIEENKESVELPPMSSSQRRMVHVLLSDYPKITSESIGEEPNRKVVIKKE